MRLRHAFVGLSLIAALPGRTFGQDKSAPPTPPTPAKVADPMASFARMVSGEWKTTAQSGTSMYDTWYWGPGRHSVRVMTDGSGADGKPWREVQVFYWHPGQKQICLLGLSPYAQGVSEGTIKLEGGTADAVFDLTQVGTPPVRRKMGLHWTFNGADGYHETLLEATGPEGLKPMNEWDHVRSRTRSVKQPRSTDETRKPSGRLKVLEPLLGRSWNTRGKWGAGDAFHIETNFEWVPLANAIYARSFKLRGNGSPIHVLDAYIYHHVGTDRLRCLVLSEPEEDGTRGGVYEGDVTVLEGTALQLDLKGYEGDRTVSYGVRLDFENDGNLHHRVWAIDGAPPERTVMLEGRQAASAMSTNIMVVFQDRKNNYWFGSDVHGVYRYDGKTTTNYTTTDGLPSNQIQEIKEDLSGNIFIATREGISKFNGQTFTMLTPIEAKEWKLEKDDLWFKGYSGMGPLRYDGASLHHLTFPTSSLDDELHKTDPGARSSSYEIYTLYRDRQGTLWFGTANLGVGRYDGKEVTWLYEDHLTNPPGGGSFGIRSIIEDKDGKFWFCNTKYRFSILPSDTGEKKTDLIRYKREEPAGNLKDADGDYIYAMSIAEDANGHLWMATWGGGVWRYDGEKATHYPVKDGDRNTTVFSIYKDNNGDLWLGTHEAGAYKFNGKSFEKFRP